MNHICRLNKIINTVILLRYEHSTLSVSIIIPGPQSPLPPCHPSALFLLPLVGKLICTLLGELLTFLFVRNTFQALTPLADARTPTQVCALLTELFHFRLSNNPATASLHVLDMKQEV